MRYGLLLGCLLLGSVSKTRSAYDFPDFRWLMALLLLVSKVWRGLSNVFEFPLCSKVDLRPGDHSSHKV